MTKTTIYKCPSARVGDPLGVKTLKQKEGSVKYKPRNSYFEIFKDMDGNKKTILTEDLTKR